MHNTIYCGSINQDSCASYFETNLKIPSFAKFYQWDFNLAVGYNRFNLTAPIPCKQGYFLSLFIHSSSAARVAMNYMNAPYGDFSWTYGATTMKKINTLYITRLYANALIDKSFYMNTFSLSRFYPSFQNKLIKTVSASFVNSSVGISRNVTLTNCETLFIASQLKNNIVYLFLLIFKILMLIHIVL